MAVNVDTSEDKEKITQLQLELRDQTMSSFKEKEKYNEAVTKARNTLIDKVNEVKSLTTTVTGLKEELLAKGSSFKLAVVSKDDEITEVLDLYGPTDQRCSLRGVIFILFHSVHS